MGYHDGRRDPFQNKGFRERYRCMQRLRADTDLRADRLAGGIHRAVLIEVIEHHLHRTLMLLDWVVLGHDQHPSHRRKRHQTRDG